MMPQVSGQIAAVGVGENDAVTAGQMLFSIDDSVYRSAVEEDHAKLESPGSRSRSSRPPMPRPQSEAATAATRSPPPRPTTSASRRCSKSGVTPARRPPTTAR